MDDERKRYTIEIIVKDSKGEIVNKKEIECGYINIEYNWAQRYYADQVDEQHFINGMNIYIRK